MFLSLDNKSSQPVGDFRMTSNEIQANAPTLVANTKHSHLVRVSEC